MAPPALRLAPVALAAALLLAACAPAAVHGSREALSQAQAFKQYMQEYFESHNERIASIPMETLDHTFRHEGPGSRRHHVRRLIDFGVAGGGIKIDVDVVIIAAFVPEIQAALAMAEVVYGNITVASRPYFIAELSGKLVAITVCGVGIINAAMTTQNVIDHLDPKVVVFSGIAGGVNPENLIGDVTIPFKWASPQHQKYIRPMVVDNSPTSYFADMAIDFPNKFMTTDKGEYMSFTRPGCSVCSNTPNASAIQAMANSPAAVTEYFAIPMQTEVLIAPGDGFQMTPPQQFWFEVPDWLQEIAMNVSDKVSMSRVWTDPASNTTYELDHDPELRVGGNGVASSTFVDNAAYREQLYSLLKAEVVDMESPAVMQVCATNQKACLVIRSVSDLAGGDADGNKIGQFLGIAAHNAAQVLTAFITELTFPDTITPVPGPSKS